MSTTITSLETDIVDMVLHDDTQYAYVMRESKFNAIVKNKNIWNIVHHFGTDMLVAKL